jgi:hypothetical protein
MATCRVAPFLFLQYIARMLWRNSRGQPINAPAAFIHPCQPIVAKQPPTAPGWTHELKHDGCRGDTIKSFAKQSVDFCRYWQRHIKEAK